jgi:hypothetical protein
MTADYRQHCQREGDIGGHRHRPTSQRTAARIAIDQHEQQRRQHHPTDCGGHRQRSSSRITQIPGHELSFELQPRDEEEDGQQAVGCPLPNRQV